MTIDTLAVEAGQLGAGRRRNAGRLGQLAQKRLVTLTGIDGAIWVSGRVG